MDSVIWLEVGKGYIEVEFIGWRKARVVMR